MAKDLSSALRKDYINQNYGVRFFQANSYFTKKFNIINLSLQLIKILEYYKYFMEDQIEYLFNNRKVYTPENILKKQRRDR